ncbi:MAG: hypothetical protein Q7U04_14660 [Bacteriovorax sp.]|nr:hypothetical protein [Bacteriovorax sp.]
MTKILGISFLLWSSISFANVTGDWTGWGTWTYEGAGTNCITMKLSFVETKDKLKRLGGFFDCQVAEQEVDSGEWIKQGNNLIQDGIVVGNITENTIHITEKYSDTVKIVSDIAIEAGHFDYSEVWYDRNDIVIYEIAGRLFKRQ